MKSSDPSRFRIGSVPYLNARPLVHALPENITYLHPSKLAEEFALGKFDVALLPVAAALVQPGCLLVDGLGIASDGPVSSVILVLRKALADSGRLKKPESPPQGVGSDGTSED